MARLYGGAAGRGRNRPDRSLGAATVFVGAFSFGGSYLLYMVTDAVITLRVRPEQEELGLDLSQHDETLDATA